MFAGEKKKTIDKEKKQKKTKYNKKNKCCVT